MKNFILYVILPVIFYIAGAIHGYTTRWDQPINDEKRFIIKTFDKNTLSPIGTFYADSIDFQSIKEAIIWSDGHKFQVFAPEYIKCKERR